MPFNVGTGGRPRVLVCTSGDAQLEHGENNYILNKGGVFLLPAAVGVCLLRPRSEVSLFEIAIPEGNITK